MDASTTMMSIWTSLLLFNLVPLILIISLAMAFRYLCLPIVVKKQTEQVLPQALRLPGTSARKQFLRARTTMFSALLFIPIALTALMLAVFAVETLVNARPAQLSIYVNFAIAITLCGAAWYYYRTQYKYSHWLAHNIKAKSDTADELDRLEDVGFRVFHDLVIDGQKIDHVVVGAQGVWTVETKNRVASVKDDEENNLIYEDGILYFSSWREQAQFSEIESQAERLSNWLAGKTGFGIRVSPVLAFPDWYIHLKKHPRYPIINPRNAIYFFPKYQTNEELPPDAADAAISQLEKALKKSYQFH